MIAKRLSLFLLVGALFWAGCGQVNKSTPVTLPKTAIPSAQPSFTPTIKSFLTLVTPPPSPTRPTETPIPTLILDPTITLDPNKTYPAPKPTVTAPVWNGSKLTLPSGLTAEEFPTTLEDHYETWLQIAPRYQNRGGLYNKPQGGELDNGKLFHAYEGVAGQIIGTIDGTTVTDIQCMPNTVPAVITAWTYKNHWIIQSICGKAYDVIWDGISLNNSKGYQSSLGFQILDNKPFYLFNRNNKVWLSYDDQEALLGYDEVKLAYCCMSYSPPGHFERMILFLATRGDQLYYVAIGLFGKQ